MPALGMSRTLAVDFDAAIKRVTEALQAEGFGILTEVDVQATLKKKLNIDFRRYRILGACNPSLAHQALTADLAAGVLMPCNVVVYEDTPGKTCVTIVDPLQTAAGATPGALKMVLDEVKPKLSAVLERL